ncbi:MAG: nuclear transport factor 2 family protein [Halieaceae bacterium]|nr:nuclear transport factor 2 family protein [Halieaceae bacterium]
MSEQELINKQLTRAFFALMDKADADAIADSYADDGYVQTMGNTLISGKRGKEETRVFAGGILAAFPEGLKFTIHSMTAEADRVAVEASSKGMHISGALYTNEYHFLFRWRNNKLAELKEYMDTEVVTDILCGGAKPS